MPRSAEDRPETEELDSVTGDDEDSVEQFFVPRTGAAGVEKDEEEGEDAEANEGEVDDVERGHRVFSSIGNPPCCNLKYHEGV